MQANKTGTQAFLQGNFGQEKMGDVYKEIGINNLTVLPFPSASWEINFCCASLLFLTAFKKAVKMGNHTSIHAQFMWVVVFLLRWPYINSKSSVIRVGLRVFLPRKSTNSQMCPECFMSTPSFKGREEQVVKGQKNLGSNYFTLLFGMYKMLPWGCFSNEEICHRRRVCVCVCMEYWCST